MSGYTGLYVEKLSNGIIVNVQVRDSVSNSTMAFDPHVYEARNTQPIINSLPDKKTYEARIQKSGEI